MYSTANYAKLLSLALCASVFPRVIPVRVFNVNVDELLSNCSLLALDAVNYPGRPRDASVYVIWNSSVDREITFIAARSERTLVLLRNRFNATGGAYRRILPDVLLLYSPNFTDFLSLSSKLHKSHLAWFPRTVFIVCLQSAHVSSRLSAVASLLYSINAYNFVILKRSDQNSSTVDVYKWYPFAASSRCGALLDVRKINVCDGSRMLQPTTELFSTYRARTFPKGCVIRATAFHWPPYTYASPPETRNFVDGLIVRMMEALMHTYDVQVNYTRVDNRGRWGMLLKNDSWTGILGVLQRAEADVAVGQILQTPSRFEYFDSSYTCPLFMKFYLALPDRLPHWKSMIRIFSVTFWTTVSAVYVITSVFTCAVSRLTERSAKTHFHNSCGNCFLNLWRVALNVPATEPSSETTRFVFLSWVIYSFHITLIYSSALLGVITTPMVEEPTIRTMEEFSASDLHLLVVPQFVQISSLMDEGIRKMIAEKYNELKITNAEEIERMIAKKDFAIADPHDHFEIVAREKLESIYSLDNFVRLNQGVYLSKGNVFLKYVDTIQRLVMENGLFEKWRRDLVGVDLYMKKHHKIAYRNEVLPLTVDELSGSFYLLLFGLSVSGICFCLELGYERLRIFK